MDASKDLNVWFSSNPTDRAWYLFRRAVEEAKVWCDIELKGRVRQELSGLYFIELSDGKHGTGFAMSKDALCEFGVSPNEMLEINAWPVIRTFARMRDYRTETISSAYQKLYRNDVGPLRWGELRKDLGISPITPRLNRLNPFNAKDRFLVALEKSVDAAEGSRTDFALVETYPHSSYIGFVCDAATAESLGRFGKVKTDLTASGPDKWGIYVDPRLDFKKVLRVFEILDAGY